jgi:hypothetical protein
MALTTQAGWIPAERKPEQLGRTYVVRVQKNVIGIPEISETTALWTTDGWEFTDGLFAPGQSRVMAWKPLGGKDGTS